MTIPNSRSQLAVRRAELLAELLLQELGATSISRPPSDDLGYDMLVGFSNLKGGTNTFAIQVKAVERPPGTHYPLPRQNYNQMAHSNLPSLLIVADAKNNHLYYAWPAAHQENKSGANLSIPLVEIHDSAKKDLKRHFQAVAREIAAAG